MSSLIIEVCKIEEIAVHPNADRLERVRVKNWWCVTGKGNHKVGEAVVYIPPGSILPEPLAEKWGIAKYCVQLGKDISGERPPGLRVRACRLRSIASFGTIQPLDDPTWEIGKDVREYYGITKYEPLERSTDGDTASPVAAFHAYTDIESIGNFPGVFQDGEEVVVTEKIHGTNCRVGLVLHTDDTGALTWQWMAGSHNNRRKEFNNKGIRSLYWKPLVTEDSDDSLQQGLRDLIIAVKAEEIAQNAVIVFGEIFGPGVQDMSYGQKEKVFRVFDISVDGNYLGWEKLTGYLTQHIPEVVVPVLYRGVYSLAQMDILADGPTVVCTPDQI